MDWHSVLTHHLYKYLDPLVTQLGGLFLRCVLLIQPALKIMKKSVSFVVLSDVSSEADVFDHLLPVRREDTGEEGTLLCSHYCKWPNDLVDKATWLEGCFTPEEYEKDPRLVLGYHPGSITRWEYEVGEDGSVRLTVFIITFEVLEVDLPVPLRQYQEDDPAWYPRRRVMDRLWRNASEAAPSDSEALPAYYREVVALVERGVLHPLVASSYLPRGMTRWTQNEPRFTQGSFWDSEEGCSFIAYYDLIMVCEDNPALGFLEAIPLFRRPRSGRVIGYYRPAPGDFKYVDHTGRRIEV